MQFSPDDVFEGALLPGMTLTELCSLRFSGQACQATRDVKILKLEPTHEFKPISKPEP